MQRSNELRLIVKLIESMQTLSVNIYHIFVANKFLLFTIKQNTKYYTIIILCEILSKNILAHIKCTATLITLEKVVPCNIVCH